MDSTAGQGEFGWRNLVPDVDAERPVPPRASARDAFLGSVLPWCLLALVLCAVGSMLAAATLSSLFTLGY